MGPSGAQGTAGTSGRGLGAVSWGGARPVGPAAVSGRRVGRTEGNSRASGWCQRRAWWHWRRLGWEGRQSQPGITAQDGSGRAEGGQF